ncbi:MAG: M15 family metallopeptidase [Abitibacteriaceae bacterium]|nr:M15 family metallopeptidase [Abditibacteriaceae bacterium]MBV9868805.1 M15 family metallopeptidase [Abditibacteriaceae bacterium]
MYLIRFLFTSLVTMLPLLMHVALAGDARGKSAPLKENEDAAALVAPEKLTRDGLSPAAYAFKQQVYRLHVERGVKSGRTRIFDLPASELALIPGTKIQMQRDAAKALGKLMAAAKVDLAYDLADTGHTPEIEVRRARARRVQELGINNAYRSASHQFAIWNRNFKGYYEATAEKRKACVGGEHGLAAAELLRDYIGVRVAAPGFSNHQGGIAVDFALLLKPEPQQPEGHTELSASMAQADPWKESWFWNWLNRRAEEFGFIAYEPEPWHWEYKPDRVGKGREN